MAITLKWLGHSCFRVECEDFSIVLDPFEPMSVPGLRAIEETADLVLCSHEHHDHNYRKAVALVDDNSKKNPFTITALNSFHDDEHGSQRGENIIHILEAQGLKVVHFGDIGCMPQPDQIDQLRGADAVMIPVGGHYTVGPQEAKAIVDAVAPKVVVPMHYRSDTFGFDVIGPLEDYLEICGRWVRYDSDTLEITPDSPRHTAVLTYKA